MMLVFLSDSFAHVPQVMEFSQAGLKPKLRAVCVALEKSITSAKQAAKLCEVAAVSFHNEARNLQGCLAEIETATDAL